MLGDLQVEAFGLLALQLEDLGGLEVGGGEFEVLLLQGGFCGVVFVLYGEDVLVQGHFVF